MTCNEKIDVELLRRVRAAILETPQQFHMDSWCIGEIYPGAADKASGTACIAGWAVVLGCRTRLSRLEGAEIERRARGLLGLDEKQVERLFLLSGWPWALQQQFHFNPQKEADYIHNAQVAARRIEVFIQTGGAE